MAAAAAGGGTLLSRISSDITDDDAFMSRVGGDVTSSSSSDDEVTVQFTMTHMIVQYGYPLLRLFIALLIVYMASGVSVYVLRFISFVFKISLESHPQRIFSAL